MIPIEISTKISQLSEHYFEKMVALRRELHQFPEVSYKEYKTTEKLCAILTDLGYEVHRPIETGCIAVLEGGIASDRVIALRADIDALPLKEEGEAKKDFISQHEGTAHCCGHDAHTANLIGVAHILRDLKEELTGKVVLIFQPGEEKLPGGGRLICESGILQKLGVQAIYGLHTFPYYAPGEIGVIKGRAMARPDEFELIIEGKGGHAAAPHLAVDPIVTAAQVITSIQTIRSRNINPLEPVVITVGKIEGGTVHNVIPQSVRMLGTIRSFSRETAHFMSQRIDEIAKGITQAAGGSYKYTYSEGYPAVINVDWATDVIVESAENVVGAASVQWLPEPVMGGEDFAFYLEHFPGAFFLLGTGSDEADSRYSWHHPKYNVDERAMMTGAAVMAGIVFNENATGVLHEQ